MLAIWNQTFQDIRLTYFSKEKKPVETLLGHISSFEHMVAVKLVGGDLRREYSYYQSTGQRYSEIKCSFPSAHGSYLWAYDCPDPLPEPVANYRANCNYPRCKRSYILCSY